MSNNIPATHDAGHGQAGFTLVEVLIAIVVLVFGLIAVTNLFLVAASSNTVANQATAAADTAAQALENLKALNFDNAALNGGTTTLPIQVYAGVGPITTTITITVVDPQTKFIRVRSEGAGLLGRGRSRAEFTTYRTCTTPTLGCI